MNLEESETIISITFVLDTTGSMGQYILACIDNIRETIERIRKLYPTKIIRFALVVYRDHPPQDKTYVTRVFDFTTDITTFENSLKSLSAAGGGDGPEALTAGLNAASDLPWEEGGTNIIIVITDAPAHGLGESDDGFPNGDPDGLDPLVIARNLKERGIVIYTVGCEPTISNYKYAQAFMISLAEITCGKYVPLSSASSLPEVIFGGTVEMQEMETLQQEYAETLKGFIAEERDREERECGNIDEKKVTRAVSERLHNMTSHKRMARLEVDEVHDENTCHYVRSATLSEARTKISRNIHEEEEDDEEEEGEEDDRCDETIFRSYRSPGLSSKRMHSDSTGEMPPPKTTRNVSVVTREVDIDTCMRMVSRTLSKTTK